MGNELENSYTEYAGREVRTIITSMAELTQNAASPRTRKVIIEALEEKGISLEQLLQVGKNPDVHPFDLSCNIAFNAPIRTRRERAERLKKAEKRLPNRSKPEALTNLSEILTNTSILEQPSLMILQF